MINGKTITLAVPCKNEAGIIAKLIKKVPDYIDEILIIDNNSTDNTAQIAEKLGARVIKEDKTHNGIGYGHAHISGINNATGDYIVAMDGDDTYPLRSVKKIIEYCEKNDLDFVSCSRLPLKNKKAISLVRQIGIHILNIQTRIFYGYPISDILTGMWVAKRAKLQQLPLKEGGWDFSPEVKLAAINSPFINYDEYHINHFQRLHEPSKQQIFKTGFAHAWYVMRRRFTIDNPLYGFTSSLARQLGSITGMF